MVRPFHGSKFETGKNALNINACHAPQCSIRSLYRNEFTAPMETCIGMSLCAGVGETLAPRPVRTVCGVFRSAAARPGASRLRCSDLLQRIAKQLRVRGCSLIRSLARAGRRDPGAIRGIMSRPRVADGARVAAGAVVDGLHDSSSPPRGARYVVIPATAELTEN